MPYHPPIWTIAVETVFAVSQTTRQGLSEAEAQTRLQQYGFNELPTPVQRSLWLRFADQLTHFMALLLWIAGSLAFVSGIPELGWAIWAVIWINALFSFWQEFQAEKALSALQNVLPTQVKVLREGLLKLIPARELVPGDVMQLEEGDRISADARLIEVQALNVDMAVLTGESVPRTRSADPCQTETLRPADAPNLVFAGSTVASGRGLAVVYATGTHTEFGQVAHLTAHVQREASTLEGEISKVVHRITAIALGMGVFIFILSKLLVGMELRESFIFSIGIIVAFVPEGLLPTVSLALAIGVKRMARKNALVRRLSAVETLSATTVICTDKTGTLTKNEMTVRYLWLPRSQGSGEVTVTGIGYDPTAGHLEIPATELNDPIEQLMTLAILCCNAQVKRQAQSSQWQAVGDPTEAALVVVGLKAGVDLDKLTVTLPRVREIPFDSMRRRMSVVIDTQRSPHFANAPYLMIMKGAPLEVLEACNQVQIDGSVQRLTSDLRSQIAQNNDRFASQGYRVLGVALRSGTGEFITCPSETLETDLTFIGLIAMIDPPRAEVANAIAACHQAGIRVTMVTGDYGLTAEAIAQKIGLVNGKARMITGEQLSHLSNAQLKQILYRWNGSIIFARMMPEQKLRLVQTYKEMGHIVAVTGDGVNDAPALRSAHIGIAMGLNGTDVAREAADIVLIDDNFATIISAIEQGRSVYQNIRKFITYILASNVAEFFPFLFMVLFKIPPALVILQILAIDLGTDMLPALALGAEKPEAGMMNQPPRQLSQPLLDKSLMLRAYCFLGFLEGILSMVGFFSVWLAHGYDLPAIQAIAPTILNHSASASIMAIYHQATTVTLAAIVACQDGNVFACRSERVSIFQLGFFSNRLIWLGIAIEWALILSIIYISPLQKLFSTTTFPLSYWFLLGLCPPILLLADELRKRILYRSVKQG
ncbi:MAG: cation-transporting P-type ATPase [Synechococcales bacterium]|nr:cation-transporting P-type ATPase [Synechococcales bacterium]